MGIVSKGFWLAIVCIFIQLGVGNSSNGEIRRHFILYGRISFSEAELVAKYGDILVVGSINREVLRRIKKLNPNLIMLKYQDCIGVTRRTLDWYKVVNHEDWFTHDMVSNERVIEKRYGWYLMNLASKSWRHFQVRNIIYSTRNKIYDGVFLDNCWSKFVNKFVTEKTQKKAVLSGEIVQGWKAYVKLLLKNLRKSYQGLIFINGTDVDYAEYVDGFMEESFIHSSWNPDSFQHGVKWYFRMLKKIERIRKLRKYILLQSGTRGDGTGDIDKLYRYCFGTYLLVSNIYTSFNFQPSRTYYFTGLFHEEDYNLKLGEPKGNYYILKIDRSRRHAVCQHDTDKYTETPGHLLGGASRETSRESREHTFLKMASEGNIILKRDFRNGSVLVNCCDKDITFKLRNSCGAKGEKSIAISAHDALILLKNSGGCR